MKTREIAYGGLSIALLAICSWISIPFTIPFTLQTLAMFLICLVFGGKKGTIYVFRNKRYEKKLRIRRKL